MITVHHYDHATGRFIGTQDIPQRPPGVGLPAGCTEVPPPADVPEGQRARWTGDDWVVEPVPVPPPPLYGYDESGICTGPLHPGQPLARSTDVPPPDPEPGTVAVWDGQEWGVVEDHRGQTVYETATGFPRVLAAVGPIPEDCTEMAWPGVGHVWDGAAWTLTLEAAKAAKRAEIQAAKAAALDAGFLVDGDLFDSDANARLAYMELALRLQAAPDYSTPWKASLGVWVTMDAATFSRVQSAGTAHVQSLFEQQRQYDAALDAITGETPDAVAAVQAIAVAYAVPGA